MTPIGSQVIYILGGNLHQANGWRWPNPAEVVQ
jgi:hypothetical protein